jgi:hypothetical protein
MSDMMVVVLMAAFLAGGVYCILAVCMYALWGRWKQAEVTETEKNNETAQGTAQGTSQGTAQGTAQGTEQAVAAPIRTPPALSGYRGSPSTNTAVSPKWTPTALSGYRNSPGTVKISTTLPPQRNQRFGMY